jgi:hypothetical protein
MRSKAVQAFWAMHVEAMTWCGMSAESYAKAHHLSLHSLTRWRGLLEPARSKSTGDPNFIRVPARK